MVMALPIENSITSIEHLPNSDDPELLERQKRFTMSTFMNMKGGGFDKAENVDIFLSNQKNKEFFGSIIAGGIAGSPGGPAGVGLGALAGAVGYGVGNIPTSKPRNNTRRH